MSFITVYMYIMYATLYSPEDTTRCKVYRCEDAQCNALACIYIAACICMYSEVHVPFRCYVVYSVNLPCACSTPPDRVFTTMAVHSQGQF